MPKACEMPSFSITSTAAITAFIRAISVSFLATEKSVATCLEIVEAMVGAGFDSVNPSQGISDIPCRNGLRVCAYIARMDRVQGIRLFIRVVETGSFSKAASDLGLTQPTATKHVAEL